MRKIFTAINQVGFATERAFDFGAKVFGILMAMRGK